MLQQVYEVEGSERRILSGIIEECEKLLGIAWAYQWCQLLHTHFAKMGNAFHIISNLSTILTIDTR
jgi:hypothetical protein